MSKYRVKKLSLLLCWNMKQWNLIAPGVLFRSSSACVGSQITVSQQTSLSSCTIRMTSSYATRLTIWKYELWRELFAHNTHVFICLFILIFHICVIEEWTQRDKAEGKVWTLRKVWKMGTGVWGRLRWNIFEGEMWSTRKETLVQGLLQDKRVFQVQMEWFC